MSSHFYASDPCDTCQCDPCVCSWHTYSHSNALGNSRNTSALPANWTARLWIGIVVLLILTIVIW